MSVTWNGSTISGPVLIYVDEIPVDNYRTAEISERDIRPGDLVCRSQGRARVSWYFTDGVVVSATPLSESKGYIQTRTRENEVPSLSRLSLGRESVFNTEPRQNGLWHCRLNDNEMTNEINVGIFSRGGGKQAMHVHCLVSTHSRGKNIMYTPLEQKLLQAKDTLGPIIVSIAEKMSSSRRFQNVHNIKKGIATFGTLQCVLYDFLGGSYQRFH